MGILKRIRNGKGQYGVSRRLPPNRLGLIQFRRWYGSDRKLAQSVLNSLNIAAATGTLNEVLESITRRTGLKNALPKALCTVGHKLHEFQLPIVASCVYFLCLGDDVVYIGQTTNLTRRIIVHMNSSSKLFDRVFYIHVPRQSLLTVEAKFISEFQPRLNQKGILAIDDDDMTIVERERSVHDEE